MTLRLVQVNIKAADDRALGRFWAGVLGWETEYEADIVTCLVPPGFDWPDPSAVCIDLVRVPDPENVRYPVSLDLATTSPDHHAELVARVRELGATPVAADFPGGDEGPWTVLADPEGNVFRVLEPSDLYGDTGPIAAVVFRCHDPRAMAAYFDAALDWDLLEVSDDAARLRASQGVGPYLEPVRTPDPLAVPSRLHLDLMGNPITTRDAEVDRLLTLGATVADVGQPTDATWRVLADPEGNTFCVLGRHE